MILWQRIPISLVLGDENIGEEDRDAGGDAGRPGKAKQSGL